MLDDKGVKYVEQDLMHSGWFIPVEHADDGIIMMCKKERRGLICDLMGMVLEVPAMYWKNDLSSCYWQCNQYDECLQKIDEEMMRSFIILIVKVLRRGEHGCYDVALLPNTKDDKVSSVCMVDARQFVWLPPPPP